MAKGRFLSKSASTSQKLANLSSDSVRLLWTWLLPHLDREGRFFAEPSVVKGHAVPRLKNHTEETIEIHLAELAKAGLIILYRVSGDLYLQFTQFDKNQPGLRKEREAESQCPAPPDKLRSNSGVIPELVGEKEKQALILKDKLKLELELKNKPEPTGEHIDSKFAEFWTAYPQAGRHAKKESRVKFGALVKRGELLEFIKGFHGYIDFLKHQKLKKKFDQTPMYAKTFLNGRWSEFVGFKFEPEL